MKTKTKLSNRFMSIILCLTLILTYIPMATLTASGANANQAGNAVADNGTAYTYENMMGTESDGNRYAGRVWADKSVYTDGQTAVLNTSGEQGSTFEVSLSDEEAFQIIFSALGSSMTTTTSSSSSGPMDVVIILDNSSSMGRYTNTSTKYSRLEAVKDASNTLISQILSNSQNRLAVVTYSTDSTVILPLDFYDQTGNDNVLTLSTWNKGNPDSSGGVKVEDGDGKMTATALKTVTVNNKTTTTTVTNTNDGFQRGTNLQSGIDAGMKLLNNDDTINTTGRTPVVIVLTDGVADTAVKTNWHSVTKSNYLQPSDNELTKEVALSTLLNASYWKASLQKKYGKAAMVYGVGVDLGTNSDAEIVMNPASAFNSLPESTDLAKKAYDLFNSWKSTETESVKSGSWTFNQLPADSKVSQTDVINNINYVDTYYNVSSVDLSSVFSQIYEELSTAAFNPISTTTTVDGATGVDNTPLIYVDNIGQYMEIKDIQAVTLFGASYDVIKTSDSNGDTYTVEYGEGTNPTTNEKYITSEDIIITVTENADGTQKLQIKINQEILPILLEQVTDKTVGDTNTVTISELTYNPLRVYYTVGLDSDILLPNGKVDVSKIDSGYKYIDTDTGEIQ